jgi:IS30 family transposase
MLQMGYRKRRHYTEAEKALMWDRWQKGDSMNEIGRWFGIQGHSSIQRVFSETGGIRPAERRRSARSLSLTEREEISRGLVAGRSVRAIAAQLARAPSTISREIRRNRGRRCYRAHQADQAA